MLVNVRLDPDGPLYDSALIRLDQAERLLYLDEFKPMEPDEGIDPGQALDVFASLRGIAIRFTMQVQEVLQSHSSRLYVGRFPEQMVYLQRRDIFRVHLPLYDKRHLRLRSPLTSDEVDARLIDISVKGFCVEAPETAFDGVRIGMRFGYLDMDLPGLRTSLAGTGTLVNLRPSPRSGVVSAGFAIEDLDPQTERSLMRAALYYQREAKRTGG
ncbi:flagellar brake protein [Imhoffiella purpurea]|uniref:flagellar brake protein n=1 Tax=Imhoffiella purpurea TaxID=1249627 RepID=UPI001E29D406|nr:flagellar brake protein [Imhoffiella purpurea]